MLTEKRGKIIWNRSGKGYLSPKIALWGSFIEDMGISAEDREIVVTYDSEKKEIIIKKSK